MFKIGAGIILIAFSAFVLVKGDINTANFSMIIAIALIGAGFDTIFYKK